MCKQLTEECKNCMYNDPSLNTEVGRSSSSRCGCFCFSSVLSWNWPCLYLYKMCKIFLSFAVDMSWVNRTLILSKPLWEGMDVTFRQVPWILHGSNSRFLEPQLHGYVLIIAANPKQELWNTKYPLHVKLW